MLLLTTGKKSANFALKAQKYGSYAAQENDFCLILQPALPCGCMPYSHRDFSKTGKAGSAATFFIVTLPKLPLTPLSLSLYNLQSPPTADIKIDIETVEKLIGEIIVQPLR